MSKLIPLDEAARLLGVSVERLTEMRSNNEIFAYRDGSNWKFKMSELERVADEFGLSLAGESGNVLEDPGSAEEGSSFFLSESAKDLLNEEQSQISGLSGISDLDLSNELESSAKKDKFAEGESVELPEDSSADLFGNDGDESEFDFDLGDSSIESGGDSVEINLEESGILSKDELGNASGSKKSTDSSQDSIFDDDDELSFGSSSIKLASESSRKLAAAGTDSDVLNEQSDGSKSPSSTGKMLADQDDQSFAMSDEDLFEDDISIADGSVDESIELGSDFGESEELILDDSDSSSEVRLDAGESGINLAANESGIELMEDDSSLELGGSDIDALELPEDDDELIELESNDDNEFNLTPLADPLEEDESTGSQVIALEDSEIYADESAEALLDDDFAAQPAGLEDSFDQGFDGGLGDAAGFMPDSMTIPSGPAAVPEAPYSVWNVLSLATAAMLMLLGSMVAYEACQNMWMADEALSRRGVLSFFLKLTGG